MAPWMSRPLLLYRCGNLSWIPLFRPWRVISYAPILAIRQFRAKKFIPTTVGLASLELMYGQPGQAQLLNQMMQAWKDLHRMRLGQIVEGCTSKYTIWRGQKIEDIVPLPARMRVLVLDLAPIQPSEVEIVRLEFTSERLEMEQKYLRLQKITNKAKSNARIHERKV